MIRSLSRAVAATALVALAAVPAAQAARPLHRAPAVVRGQVLSVSGTSAEVVTRRLEIRRYTLTGASVRFGDQVVLSASGATRRATVVSRQDSVSYLASAAAPAGAGSLSVTVLGARVTYHASHHLSLLLPAHRIARGSRLLVTVRDTGRYTVTAQFAAGAPAAGSVPTSGIITDISGRRVTLLTNAGRKVNVTLPSGMNATGLTSCKPISLYYTPGADNLASLVSPSDDAPVSGCKHLTAAYGFVRAVANDDSTLTVHTERGTVTLQVASPSLRAEVDSVSITDYVIVTYLSGHGTDTLESVDDMSSSDMGVVLQVHTTDVRVRTWLNGDVDLIATHPQDLHGVRSGDAVDIDYYTAFDGTSYLVNIDDRGPARNGGNGGGPSGSGGSAGSGGSWGSWGSWGSAGA